MVLYFNIWHSYYHPSCCFTMHTFNQLFAEDCIRSKGCFLISDAHILLLDSFMPSSFVSLFLLPIGNGQSSYAF